MAKKKQTKTKNKKPSKEESKKLEFEEDKGVSKKVINRENKQIIAFVVVIVILFASFLGPYYYVKNQRVFDYNNLTWQVEKDEDVTFYHTQFGKYYKGNYYGPHNTYLRNDPRTNDIPITLRPIQFYKSVAITTDPALLECGKQILVTDSIAQMTQALPFISNVTFGLSEKEAADNSQYKYISCEDKPEKTTIIQIQKGETSQVYETKDGGCIIVEIATCEENLITAEKLVIETITQLNN